MNINTNTKLIKANNHPKVVNLARETYTDYSDEEIEEILMNLGGYVTTLMKMEKETWK